MTNAVKVGRVILIVAFTFSGFAHLFAADMFLPLMPPVFPEPLNWIYVSGAMELIAALLLALKIQGGPTLAFITLLAVWPGNWWMAIEATADGDIALFCSEIPCRGLFQNTCPNSPLGCCGGCR
jgi:uncharacterized membrane protein